VAGFSAIYGVRYTGKNTPKEKKKTGKNVFRLTKNYRDSPVFIYLLFTYG